MLNANNNHSHVDVPRGTVKGSYVKRHLIDTRGMSAMLKIDAIRELRREYPRRDFCLEVGTYSGLAIVFIDIYLKN